MQGTNYGQEGSPVVNPYLTDVNNNGLLVVGASASATAGYSTGCILLDNVSGKMYVNTGNATTATWTVQA